MKMGKLLLGKIFVVAAVIVMPLLLTACGPTLLAFEPPAAKLSSIVLYADGVKADGTDGVPTRTAYMSGEFFDTTGLTVAAVYTDRTRKVIALDDVVYDKVPLTLNNTVITFSYTEGTGSNAITASASLDVDVTVMTGGEENLYDKVWWGVQDDGPVYSDSGDILWGYKGTMPKNYTLDIVPGTRVIAESAFYHYANLTAVTIPNTVTYIGAKAFWNTGVTMFDIPDSVGILGERALASAANNIVYIGAGVTENLEYSFDRGRTTVLEVSLDNKNYSTYGSILFNKDCTTLITMLTNINGYVNLNYNPITEIADGALYNCAGITELILPETLVKIGESAFAMCTGISFVAIPKTVREIGDFAFRGCTGITAVYMGNNSNTATVIGRAVFGGCTALRFVQISDRVIPSITVDVFPNNPLLEIEIRTAGNVAPRLAAVKKMPGWNVHADKITEVLQ